jgi:hypothetical protein
MARLPGKLKTFAGLINLAFILDPLAGGNFADDVDVLARALERPVEDSAVPTGDTFIRYPQTEQQSTAG